MEVWGSWRYKKFVCVGDEIYNVVEKIQFPTTKPIETIDKCIEFFSKFEDLNWAYDWFIWTN